MSALTDDEAKQLYARALIECNNDSFKAALAICGADTQRALQMSFNWPNDPDVIAERARLLNDGADELLPSKDQTALIAVQMANDSAFDPKDRVAALKLYCEIRDFLPKKEGAKIQINNQRTRNVMIVQDCGNENEWQSSLMAQQKRLMNEAAEA